MRSMEFSGRTVDEAIFAGLKEMDVTIDQVDIVTVQTESKGLFGFGAKHAIVRLTEREVAVVPDFDALNEERRQEREAERKTREDRPRREKNDSRREKESGRRERREERHGRRSSETEKNDVVPAKTYDYTSEAAAECGAAQFLQELLGKMQLNGSVKAFVNDEGIFLNIESDTDGLLIGHRGETLDALQYLTSLYENKGRKENGYKRVSVDTEGYRARREESLRRLARSKAVRVAKTGLSVEMEPMNPYERRILHSALQDFRGVTTHSEGEEPNRRVVISPAD